MDPLTPESEKKVLVTEHHHSGGSLEVSPRQPLTKSQTREVEYPDDKRCTYIFPTTGVRCAILSVSSDRKCFQHRRCGSAKYRFKNSTLQELYDTFLTDQI